MTLSKSSSFPQSRPIPRLCWTSALSEGFIHVLSIKKWHSVERDLFRRQFLNLYVSDSEAKQVKFKASGSNPSTVCMIFWFLLSSSKSPVVEILTKLVELEKKGIAVWSSISGAHRLPENISDRFLFHTLTIIVKASLAEFFNSTDRSWSHCSSLRPISCWMHNHSVCRERSSSQR